MDEKTHPEFGKPWVKFFAKIGELTEIALRDYFGEKVIVTILVARDSEPEKVCAYVKDKEKSLTMLTSAREMIQTKEEEKENASPL